MIAGKYVTWVFDCDGVLLDSNKAKTQAFYNAALAYGEEAAQQLVDYHVANGGISRYHKFEFFLREIVSAGVDGPGLEDLLVAYAKESRAGLLSCAIADGLDVLCEQAVDARWIVVSGGDQSELREVFAERGLERMFDGGIFGSPDTKDDIIERERTCGNIKMPAVFLGDSKYDYRAASRAGMDFIFISDWTELQNWSDWVHEKNINHRVSLSALIE